MTVFEIDHVTKKTTFSFGLARVMVILCNLCNCCNYTMCTDRSRDNQINLCNVAQSIVGTRMILYTGWYGYHVTCVYTLVITCMCINICCEMFVTVCFKWLWNGKFQSPLFVAMRMLKFVKDKGLSLKCDQENNFEFLVANI